MKNTLTTIVCVSILCLLVGPVSAQGKSGDNARAEEVISHLEKMGAIAAKHADDCEKMGTALQSYTKKHGKDLKAAVIALDSLSEDKQQALEKKYKERAEKAMEGFMQTANCMSNGKVMEAMQVLDAQEEPTGHNHGQEHGHDGDHGHDHGKGGDHGHAHEEKPQAKPSSEERKVAETLVEHIEEISATIDEHSGDCDAMGAALDAYADKHNAEMKKLVAATEEFPEDVDQALQAQFQPRLEKAIGSFMNIGQCGENAAVEAAMKKMAF